TGRGLAVIVDHRDVYMAQRGDSSCFTNEARAVVMVSGSEKLDRDSPREMQVLGEINRAHAALAKFFQDSIMGDCLADHARWVHRVAREMWLGRECYTGGLCDRITGFSRKS